jgi:hypothetical protein
MMFLRNFCVFNLTAFFIKQASLGESIQQDARTVLTINVGGQRHVIAILLPGKSEHTVMDLIFEEQKLEFTVTGKNSIHLAGSFCANISPRSFEVIVNYVPQEISWQMTTTMTTRMTMTKREG